MTAAISIQGAVTGLKRAIDLIKSISSLKQAAEIASVKIELQQIILDAQQTQFTLVERVRELEKELADLKTWGAEKENYKLVKWKHGIMAYVPKEPMDGTECSHGLCANCFGNGKKSVLQAVKLITPFNIKCAACRSEMTTTTD